MDSNAIVAAVADALDRAGIPFMLAGSFSSNFYGVSRATRDADFVIQLDSQSIPDFANALGPEFQLDPQMSFESVTGTFRYVLSHPASQFKVELFLLSSDPHDQIRFSRRKPVTLAGRQIMLPTPEDIVVTKLRWAHGGGRRKDIEDIENVLELQKDGLNVTYIRNWCDQHGTRDIFEKLWAATGSI